MQYPASLEFFCLHMWIASRAHLEQYCPLMPRNCCEIPVNVMARVPYRLCQGRNRDFFSFYCILVLFRPWLQSPLHLTDIIRHYNGHTLLCNTTTDLFNKGIRPLGVWHHTSCGVHWFEIVFTLISYSILLMAPEIPFHLNQIPQQTVLTKTTGRTRMWTMQKDMPFTMYGVVWLVPFSCTSTTPNLKHSECVALHNQLKPVLFWLQVM